MSYEMMEALVIEKIANLRASESTFAQSLQATQKNAGAANLTAAQQRIQAQLSEVEQLLAAMESAPAFQGDAIPELVAAGAAQQISSSVWI